MAIGVKDTSEDLKSYFAEAESWDRDRFVAAARSRRIAWIVAAIAIALAVVAVGAVMALTPLKTVVPYVVTVDRSTGATDVTQELRGDKSITYDEAIRKYFLADYVRTREGWIPQAREEFFRKVLALSTREEQARWTAFYKKDNPDSPQNQFGANDAVFVAIRSVAFISPNVAQVRFVKRLERDQQAIETPAIATITFDVLSKPETEAGRYANPLGFQVRSYRADAEVAIR
ncbi:virB8 family protein [Sphingomonas carotinifaciens]|uniref:Type IV secretion system protein VirB8 n=1 Tax=Sphingomonas carotinifaciens TaxID=1166323 RepID=A0A1G7RFL0_9SPHN|nr:VirB8/TrbF family protein [Sphingomonas carotinifaciens]MBB4087990.1 type IV secretion system protein VirB8 [Sphingomonas carotinifaciens]MWC45530.1 virB8 family protein [Sphingomonas carotinifaciens]SDG08820.1 type IV secretion system protein VirB8 [Sphingomonas carotinifaciens]